MDDMTPEARRAIRLAREEFSPGDEDKRRVRKALGVGLAATAAVAGASSTEAAAAAKTAGILGAWSGWQGVLSVVLVLSIGAGGATWWSRSHGGAPSSPLPSSTQSEPPARQSGLPDEPSPVPGASSEAVAATPAPSDRDPHGRPAHTSDPLVNELTLLHRAQQAWRDGKAQQALELAQQHAATYPRSQFAMERSVLEVFALCALGRKGEARSIASELLKQAPRSPLRTSLEESCAMK